MTTRWARFARGWLVALFSTLVAAASHTLAGGSSPSIVSLVIALAFAGVACIALTGKTVSLPRMGISVLISQVAFHTLFSTLSVSAATPLVVGAGGGHEHGSTVMLLAETGAPMAHHTDGWMWLGHAVATAITTVTLRYGESAFWRLRDIAALFVRTVFALLPVVPLLPRVIRRPRVSGTVFLPRIRAFLRLSLGLRGPPVASFV
jgi:hypothetical protein